MRNHTFLVIFISMFTCSVTAQTQCEMLLEKKLKSDLTLSYSQFDQTMNAGWRTLPKHQCYKEAAQLLSTYIKQNNSTENSLSWHLFQMEAYAGNYKNALGLKRTLIINPQQASLTKLLWNDYVLANMAFLENDLVKIKQYRKNIASKAEEHFGNSLNLKIVDNLINGFGKPYRLAYEGK